VDAIIYTKIHLFKAIKMTQLPTVSYQEFQRLCFTDNYPLNLTKSQCLQQQIKSSSKTLEKEESRKLLFPRNH